MLGSCLQTILVPVIFGKFIISFTILEVMVAIYAEGLTHVGHEESKFL